MRIYPNTRIYSRGFTLIELLVSAMVFSFGLLGYSQLQQRLQTEQIMLIQRNQSIDLLHMLASQLEINSLAAKCFNIGKVQVGAGRTQPYNCSADLDADVRTRVEDDINQWHQLLQGRKSIRAPINARGCIERQTNTNSYNLRLAWQGLSEQGISAPNCGGGRSKNTKHRQSFTYSVNLSEGVLR